MGKAVFNGAAFSYIKERGFVVIKDKESRNISGGFQGDASDILFKASDIFFKDGIPGADELDQQLELVQNIQNLRQKNETLETLIETVTDKNGGIREKVNVERYRQNIRANKAEIKRNEKYLRTFFKKYGLKYSGETGGNSLKDSIISDIESYLYEIKSKVKECEGCVDQS